VLSASKKAALLGALQEFEGAARNIGLRINEEKTKYVNITRNQGTLDKNIQLTEYKNCENFKYLGEIVTDKNDKTVEIKATITAGNKCLFTVQKILHFRRM
jgi:hypothetical protein